MRTERHLIVALILSLALWGCDEHPTEPMQYDQADVGQNAGTLTARTHVTTTTTRFSTFFQATALCGPEIGRIRFSGTIEGVDHTTVDGTGNVHRTRQFRVKGLDGANLDHTTIQYRVIGGAEMLTWNTNIGHVPGNPLRSMHSGTLVFEPIGGGMGVLAHHAIRFVEAATGELVVDFHEWRCVRRG